jgi:hypothetical protein
MVLGDSPSARAAVDIADRSLYIQRIAGLVCLCLAQDPEILPCLSMPGCEISGRRRSRPVTETPLLLIRSGSESGAVGVNPNGHQYNIGEHILIPLMSQVSEGRSDRRPDNSLCRDFCESNVANRSLGARIWFPGEVPMVGVAKR